MKRAKTEEQRLAELEQARINRLFYDHLGKDAGTEIIEVLELVFELRSMIKKDKDGKVDPFHTLANCGAYEILSYIKQRIKNGKVAR